MNRLSAVMEAARHSTLLRMFLFFIFIFLSIYLFKYRYIS